MVKKGRKLAETSLRILCQLVDRGVMTAVELVDDLIDIHQYDENVRHRLYKQIYNLGQYGYLEIKKDKKNQSFFHLTPKGKLRALKYLHLEKIRGKKWDGHWRVIIFDIPETLKKWREYLRGDLKNLGFRSLQESVYITPYPVTGELDEMLKEWGLRKYFRYLTVMEIDRADQLKRFFGLK